jgi:hypothetical protein
MTPDQVRELVEDLADGAAAGQALDEPRRRCPRRAGLDRAWPEVTGPVARYGLAFRAAAPRALRKLDRPVAERINAGTEALRDDPRPPGEDAHRVTRPVAYPGGDYRIV